MSHCSSSTPNSSSSSNGSSISSGSTSSDDSASVADVPETEAAAVGKYTRSRQNRVNYGRNFLTARRMNGLTTGYQITCTHPNHIRCTKEISNSKSGSDDASKRMLLLWLLRGTRARSKEEHRDCWSDVLKFQADGKVPSLAVLEKSIIQDWSAVPPLVLKFLCPPAEWPEASSASGRGGAAARSSDAASGTV